MARTLEESITCDLSGCGKTPGNSVNAHVEVVVTHTITEDGRRIDVNDGEGRSFDFCSVEHAAEFLTAGAESDDERAADARKAARNPPEAPDVVVTNPPIGPSEPITPTEPEQTN